MAIFSVKSIKVDKDLIYPGDSVGRKFEDKLMSIAGNDKAWEIRFQKMKNNKEMIKSERFKKVIEENSKETKLRAVCNVAYFMKWKGKDAWRAPDNVNPHEQNEYWEDVWKWCSVSGGENPKPELWNKSQKSKK